jgi:CMP-N,N'-diacetyllegionaminic acid synthase
MKVLGIIPARSGSKSVENKNIRLVDNEPLIAYSIRAALQSHLLTYFLTSTDALEISNVASKYGSPIRLRPKELAQDETPIMPVVLDALDFAEQERKINFDLVILLQPTAPIRTGKDIDNVIMMFNEDKEIEGVISVCPMDDIHPARMYNFDSEGWLQPLEPGWETSRRQELPIVYYRNGAIYAIRRSVFIAQKTLMPKKKKAYIMGREILVNIDDERDLLIADVLVRHWKNGNLS